MNFELINDKHLASVSKDRTGLFNGKPEFVITSKTGEKLLAWCNSKTLSLEDVREKVEEVVSLSSLTKLYNENPKYQKTLNAEFVAKNSC